MSTLISELTSAAGHAAENSLRADSAYFSKSVCVMPVKAVPRELFGVIETYLGSQLNKTTLYSFLFAIVACTIVYGIE